MTTILRKTVALGLFFALTMGAGVDSCPRVPAQEKPTGFGDGRPKTRHEFARAMAKIKEGMTEKEVRAILGKPDDIQTQADLGGIWGTWTREIWGYGTNGHMTFPTLGCVHIGRGGKVESILGSSGKPPSPDVLPEGELRPLLCLIDRAPSYEGGTNFNPLRLVQIVNALQPLGKEKALAAIEEYLRVTPVFPDSSGRDGVFLVLRVLFDVPDDPGYMPRMRVGAPTPPAPKDAKQLPRFPIWLQDDVPFLLVSGFEGSGEPEGPERHVEYFRDKGRLRAKPLIPGNSPLKLMKAWENGPSRLYEKDDSWECKVLVANQLLNMFGSVYRRDADNGPLPTWPKGVMEAEWKRAKVEMSKLDLRWNPDKALFTVKNGYHIPERVPKEYRGHLWKLEVPDGEAEVIIGRVNTKSIRVSLTWWGKKGQKPPEFDLSLLAVIKADSKPMGRVGPSSKSKGGLHNVGDGEVESHQSFDVELAEEAEVRACVLVDKREQLSPVYTP
ncbi:hypothetical protein [Fimbriiglobus ruber]|uniref:hypothetical protein n=1 Tax=Fimbriiglobus ruber TaxID=1908690 RepID=UPI000B4A6924|nr:hypothetical protein [Fimbriiglobus ruber]